MTAPTKHLPAVLVGLTLYVSGCVFGHDRPTLTGVSPSSNTTTPAAPAQPPAPAPSTAATAGHAGCETNAARYLPEIADFVHYAAGNAGLRAAAPERRRVVLMGDSISEFWPREDAEFFARTGFIGRGISGQTTTQMLLRFRQDVIALEPAVVHILAGTNDIAGNGGAVELEAIEANIASMVDLARAHGIQVVIGSVLPAARFPWRPEVVPAPRIAALNRWLRESARSLGFTYVDYYGAVSDGAAGIRADLSPDGVHPNLAGYRVMEPLAEAAIRAAQRRWTRPHARD